MNKVMLSLFLLSTILFLYQHSTGLSWDFTVYKLNSDYLYTGKGFFEWGRPPLASLLMFNETFYIIIVSVIGLIAVNKFSKKYHLRQEVVYSLILTPFTLIYGLKIGTEYLSLSLTMLMLSYLDDGLSGLFFGLSFLTHYSNVINGLFLLFSKRKINSLILFLLVIAPWLIFNYSIMKDPFYSIIDQYVKNILMRDYLHFAPELIHLLIIASFTSILFIYGLIKAFGKPTKNDWLMLLFFMIKVLTYVKTPVKIPRYLYLTLIPITYFSAKGLSRLKNKATILIITLTMLFIIPYSQYFNLEKRSIYERPLTMINKSCMLMSNAWPFANYLGVNASPFPRKEAVSKRLNEGYTVLLYKNSIEPSYTINKSFIKTLPVIYEDKNLLILSNESVCKPTYYYNLSYMQELNDTFTITDLI